jgi:hypothetical protein
VEAGIVVREKPHRSGQQKGFARRTFLRTAAVAGTALGGVGLASAARSDGDNGFPPNGTTTYGAEIELGDGSARPFTTETPSGEPKYHGIEIDRAALDGLPDADELRDSGEDRYTDKYSPTGEALQIHRKWALEFFVEFPSAENTPFTFLGLNWNPNGHPGGRGAWEVPHFDIHFHMLAMETIDAIEGPELPPYDEIVERNEEDVPTEIDSELAAEQLPDGYVRPPPPVAEERYITDMGEHTAPADAPELPADPDAFTNTLIQGFVGRGCNGEDPELAFIEPMTTKEFLEDVSATESYEIAQPSVYPHDQHHPTEYSVRDLPGEDAIAVAIQAFEEI